MSTTSLERSILMEIKIITGRRSLRVVDLLEWSTDEETVRKNVRESEVVVHVPHYGVWAAIPKVK